MKRVMILFLCLFLIGCPGKEENGEENERVKIIEEPKSIEEEKKENIKDENKIPEDKNVPNETKTIEAKNPDVSINFVLDSYPVLPAHPSPSLKLYVRYYLKKYMNIPLKNVAFENGVKNLIVKFYTTPSQETLTTLETFLSGLNYQKQD